LYSTFLPTHYSGAVIGFSYTLPKGTFQNNTQVFWTYYDNPSASC
jgi:hypothetical protein